MLNIIKQSRSKSRQLLDQGKQLKAVKKELLHQRKLNKKLHKTGQMQIIKTFKKELKQKDSEIKAITNSRDYFLSKITIDQPKV